MRLTLSLQSPCSPRQTAPRLPQVAATTHRIAPRTSQAATPAGLRAPQPQRIVPQAPGLPSLRQPQAVQDDAHMFLRFAREDGPAAAAIRWQFDIKSAALEGAGLRQEVLRDLHLEATRQALAPWLARAEEVGLRLDLAPSEAGVQITLEGSSAPARRLLDEVLHQLTRNVPSYGSFCDSRDSVRRAYAAVAVGRTPLRERHTPAQRRLALDDLRVSDLLAFGRRLGDSTYVLGFLYGNMRPTDVESVRASLMHAFHGEPYSAGRQHHRSFAS